MSDTPNYGFGKFVPGFDMVFEADGTDLKRVGPLAPNMTAYAERWVRSAREECLLRLSAFYIAS